MQDSPSPADESGTERNDHDAADDAGAAAQDEPPDRGSADDESAEAEGPTAIVVARRADRQPDTEEIRALAESAGYAVVDELTQRRTADGTYHVGRGKARELARRVAATGVDAVVFDNELTPGQHGDLLSLLPDSTELLDRHRLVLSVFEAGTGDEAARLQVELAKLRYALPRVRETEERTHMQEATETGSRVVDLERRIRTVERKLAQLSDRAAERRDERREAGFDLVALAGYTNAGKSTLLHRLADDLAVADLDGDHDDVAGPATVADRLFETLDTTTRRATINGRRVLLTDTVGLVDGLPHDLVASFSATLSAVADSDVGVLVVDASDAVADVRAKLRVCLGELDDPRGRLLVALNKVDRLDADEVAARREAVAAVPGAEERVNSVVAISALAGAGADELRAAVVDAVPTEQAQFDLPNDGETQAFLAWAHDHGRVDAAYEGERVRVRFTARPAVVERARSRAAEPRD